MDVSIIDIQRDIILGVVRNTAPEDWKILVTDESTRKIIDNVVKKDEILDQQFIGVELIEARRQMYQDVDAIYILSPQPHVVDCLLADFDRRRYRRAFLIWTSILDPQLRKRIDSSPHAREQIAGFQVLSIEFYPRESRLVSFRDPWSFPILYHPACNNLVKDHMTNLAQKIVGLCVALGEYPTIRYYRPRNPHHEAAVLCSHLARFVQDELDTYAHYHSEFPPQVNRPRGILLITDRSMDLNSPLVHELTYQAMAHDLLPIREGDKVIYKTVLNAGEPTEEQKDMEISDRDKVWVENRHLFMGLALEKLRSAFQKFMSENTVFTQSSEGQATSTNDIKDMMAGLPEFQTRKEEYTLHINMTLDCTRLFEERNIVEISALEQTLATGLDEDNRKAKNVAEQVVRLLDDEKVNTSDRLRLIAVYLLYRDGLLPTDTQRLLAHAHLPPQEGEILQNLELLGAYFGRRLKENRPPRPSLFPRPPKSTVAQEEDRFCRFSPVLKSVLEEHVNGTLDQTLFPYTKPQLDSDPDDVARSSTQSSLRSAKPTWAKKGSASNEPRQRIIVFVAGGATYAESRVVYEISKSGPREVFLATSHMLTPSLFVRQVADLSKDRRRLDIPAERPPQKPPAHIYEQDKPKPPPMAPVSQTTASVPQAPTRAPAAARTPAAPVHAMHQMSLNSGGPDASSAANGKRPEKEEKKKKHHFFGKKK